MSSDDNFVKCTREYVKGGKRGVKKLVWVYAGNLLGPVRQFIKNKTEKRENLPMIFIDWKIYYMNQR